MTKVIFEVDKLQETDLIGRLVTSNAGRDTGKSYIVIGLVDDDLLVANGATKTIEMPKKKKIKPPFSPDVRSCMHLCEMRGGF